MKNNKKSPVSVFFSNLPSMLGAGLIFSAASTIFMSISILISILTGFDNIILWGLGMIPGIIFYSGLVTVIRKCAFENGCTSLIKTYFSSVYRHAKVFLVNGIASYLICSCSIFAILYYHTLFKIDFTFCYILAVYGIFIAALIIMMFYVFLISVTYKLRLRDIYKNSVKLIIGNLPMNILVLLVIGVITTPAITAIIYTDGIFRIIVCTLSAALYPILITYIIVSMISKGMQERLGSFVPIAPADPSAPRGEEKSVTLNFADTEDDYIFVNGKMIKNPNKKNS